MRTTTRRLVFTLGVLLAINTMNFFDRQILPAVQEKIRHAWKLSDSELGWLGTAFILLYAVVGLPLGIFSALYRDGRQAEALRAYQRLRTHLGEELGIEPSTQLRELEQQVLAQVRSEHRYK